MDELSEPYWAGAAEGRLVLQKCGDCGRVRHYPQMMCPACHSFAVEHVTASGAGTVYSWTVCHHAFDPALRAEVPYTLLTVDMADGGRVLGRFAGDVAPAVGLPVQLGFEIRSGTPTPVFTTR